MALLTIRTEEDAILLKPSRAVTEFDRRLHTLLDDMRETLEATEGIGLSAPQVGVLRRVCIINTEDAGYIELVNPEVTASFGTQDEPEGCLSISGLYGYVERPMCVTVSAFNRHGEKVEHIADGFTARAFCHEMDHLDGLMFTRLVTRWYDPDKDKDKNARRRARRRGRR
jgi:peptide deformylase